MPVDAVSRFLGVLALVSGVGGIAVLVLRSHPVTALVRERAVPLAAAIATTATLGSLYYSEVAGFVPCRLCWYQRGAMYPLAVLLLLATVLPALARPARRRALRRTAVLLAAVGLLLSLWHTAVQLVPSLDGGAGCALDVPCTARWVLVFGVLSIPTMAACGFLGVLALLTAPQPDHTAHATSTPDHVTRTPERTSP